MEDQVVLVGLWKQQEATHAKALIATRQWIQANNHAALAEEARNRTKALAVQQDHVERDLCQQLA